MNLQEVNAMYPLEILVSAPFEVTEMLNPVFSSTSLLTTSIEKYDTKTVAKILKAQSKPAKSHTKAEFLAWMDSISAR